MIIEPDPENSGFVATIPAMPDIEGRGETEEEALRNMKEAFEFATEDFERTTDPETLARKQGVAPASFDELLGDFWPEDEEPEEFTHALREWRKEPARRAP